MGIGVCLFLIIFPWYQKITLLYAEFETRRDLIAAQISEDGQKETVALQVNQFQTNLDTLNESVLKDGDEIILIKFLEQVSSIHKLTQSISLSEREKVDSVVGEVAPLPHSQVTLQLEGEFQNLIGYLADLEKSRFYIIVESIVIQSTGVPQTPSIEKNVLQTNLAAPLPFEEMPLEIPVAVAPAARSPLTVTLTASVYWNEKTQL